ncbi:MAG: sigma-70 family RNA polymerase sigma factor [Planctomycetota bacterium]
MSRAHPEISLTDVAWLTALARTLTRDASEADDLVQETWVAARTSPPSSGDLSRPWLATVLRRFHLQSLRSGRRRDRRARVAARHEALPDTAELVERAELQRTLADCLLSLEDPLRSTLMLVAFEGVTTAEIAERDGVSVGTVRHRVRRARERMREKLMALDGEDWSRWHATLLPFARLPLPGETAAAGAIGSSEVVATGAKACAAAMMFKLVVSVSVVVAGLTALSLFGRDTAGDVPYVQQRVARTPAAGPALLEDVDPLGSPSSATRSVVAEDAADLAPEPLEKDAEEERSAAPAATRRDRPETATLEIRIRSEKAGWYASLAADAPAFVGRRGPSWHEGQIEAGFQMKTSGGQGAGRTCVLNISDGVYRFLNVRPGIPLRAIAIDGFFLPGDEVEVAPLLPGEERVVEVVVTRHLRSLRGRVLAPNGEPIPGAIVQIARPGDREASGDTVGPDGRFAMKRLGAEEVVLVIRAEGFAPHVEPAHRVMDTPVDFVLDGGRPVQLEVRSAGLQPFANADVVGRLPGVEFYSVEYGVTDERGVLSLDAVPAHDVALEVSLCGRTFRSVLSAAEVGHVVEVPRSRPCRVRVVGPRSGGGKYRVALRPLAPAEGSGLTVELPRDADEALFDRVFPGRYCATLQRVERRRVRRAGDAHVEFEVAPASTSTEPVEAELRL